MDFQTYVIGMGASAGGLIALKEYFKNRPLSFGEAYVIVVHSQRNYKSKLVEILSRETPIRVLWIEDNMPLDPKVIKLHNQSFFSIVSERR